MTTNLRNRVALNDPEPTEEHGRTKPLPPGIEPLLSLDDLATVLNCSRRLVERMRAAGKVPKPDLKIGKNAQVSHREYSLLDREWWQVVRIEENGK